MRLLFRHAIAVIVFLFVFKLAIEAQDHTQLQDEPKSVLLSRLADSDPIPADFSRTLEKEGAQRPNSSSEGLINSETSTNYR